jgi:hypothetical protein
MSPARARASQWVVLVAVTLAAASVFWAFDALPYQDLPAHAGALAIRQRFSESVFDRHNYREGPEMGPYAVFLLLGDLLARLMGPERAIRALSTLPVLATPAALLLARRRLHGDRRPWAGFLGVALSFGFMTLLGLAGYLLGLAALVLAFALWLELMNDLARGAPSARRELLFGAAALGVFLIHGHAFLLLFAFAAITASASGDRARRALRLRALTPAIALGAWSALRGGPPQGSAGTFALARSPDFQTPLDKLSLLVTPTLMTRWGVDVVVGLAVWCVLLASLHSTLRAREAPGGEAGPSSANARAASVAAAGAAVLFAVLPHAYLWFGFIDGRMVPAFLFLVILAVRRDALGARLARGLDAVSLAAAFVMTGLVLLATARFQVEARGYREVLAAVPAEASLLNLPLDPDSDVFTAHPFVHYDKLATIDHDVLLSDVWADRATALYATPENPQAHLPADYNSANLRRIDWEAFDLSEWTHVLVRTRPDAPPPETPASLTLFRNAGGFWLYASTQAPRARLRVP